MYWKEHASGNNMGKTADEIDRICNEFLENCAFNYFKLKDSASMMKFVKAFSSMDMKRKFLMSLECLDELLLLEEESGNFSEAAEIARLKGDILCEADMIEKEGDFDKASALILLYVLSHSLWMPGSKGWPLKSFMQKEELLKKAMSFSQYVSNSETLCTEVKVLSNESADWCDLQYLFSASQECNSLMGVNVCCRKILDFHFQCDVTKYIWDVKLLVNLHGSEELISFCQVNVGTLLQFWNSWKKSIFDILDSLECLGEVNFGEFKGVGEYCLEYFGVRQQLSGINVTYVLLHPKADWVKNIQSFVVRQNKRLLHVDARHFISAARTHWYTELLTVGLKVLETLESLYELAARSMSLFFQSMCLINIYEIAKSLSESKYHDLKSFAWRIQNYLTQSTRYFEKVFPLDPRQSMVVEMISLRRTKLSSELLEEFIVQDIGTTDPLSYGQIGRAVIISLAGKLSEDLFKKIVERILSDVPWKSFVEILSCAKLRALKGSLSGDSDDGCNFLEFQQVLSSTGNLDCFQRSSNDPEETLQIALLHKFFEALQNTFSTNLSKTDQDRIEIDDCLSPGCFLHLVERFLILVSQYQGFFFTLKSSFLEWLVSEQFGARPNSSTSFSEKFYDPIVVMIQTLICDRTGSVEWLTRSRVNVDLYYKQMVLRLVLITCLLCLNCEKYYDVLFQVLSIDDVRDQLPQELYGILQRGMENNYLQVNEIGEAFQIGGDPLLVVYCGEIVTGVEYSNVISVQLGTKSREDILSLLLPAKACSSLAQTSTVQNVMSDSCANVSSHCSDQPKSSTMPISTDTPFANQYMQVNWALFQEISDVLNSDGGDDSGTSANVFIINLKEEVTALVNFLTAAINLSSKKLEAGEDMMEEARNMLRELTELHSLMNMSILDRESIEQLLNSLLSKKPKLEAFLNQFPKDNTQCVEERLDVAGHKGAKTDLPSTTTSRKNWKLGKGKGKFKNCKVSKWKRK